MSDNQLLYILLFSNIVLSTILYKLDKKKGYINGLVLFLYNSVLYYKLIYASSGGSGLLWWFYLVVLTSCHILILILYFIVLFYKYMKRK